MTRPLRIEYAGAVYHATSRGNARTKIYHDENDRETFTDILAILVDKGERNAKVYDARLKQGYTLKEIVDALGLHYSTTRKIVQRVEEKKELFKTPSTCLSGWYPRCCNSRFTTASSPKVVVAISWIVFMDDQVPGESVE